MTFPGRKIAIWSLTGIITLYVIIVTALYFFQEKIVFQPGVLPASYQFQFDQPFEEFNIKTKDGQQLNALLFRTAEQPKGLILYFHGNRDNLQRWGRYAGDFTSLGYDILMMDYRGYGKSTGTPSETALYDDATTLWNWAKERQPYPHYIIYGRSLGSAVASQLAITAQPDLLLLETPFDELRGTPYAMFRPLLTALPSRHQFPNKKFIPKIDCRIVMIHGTQDWVVPLSSALALKPLLKPGDQLVVIEGGGHNNLRDYPQYHEVLKANL